MTEQPSLQQRLGELADDWRKRADEIYPGPCGNRVKDSLRECAARLSALLPDQPDQGEQFLRDHEQRMERVDEAIAEVRSDQPVAEQPEAERD